MSESYSSAIDWSKAVKFLRSSPQSGGRRAPYKALLLLWMIGQLHGDDSHDGEKHQNGLKENRFQFGEVKDELATLMEKHQVGRATPQVAQPFVRLINDPSRKEYSGNRIWKLYEADGNPIHGAPVEAIEKNLADGHVGILNDSFYHALSIEAQRCRIVKAILEENFQETLYNEVLLDVGLLYLSHLVVQTRNRRFVLDVREAYDSVCAFCGYDGKVGQILGGIEAAHIRAKKYGGPDTVDNGLLLCALHHKLFDLGALSLDKHYRIIVSKRFRSF